MNVLTEVQQDRLKAAIQDGLPLTATPYRTLSLQLDLPEPLVMEQIEHWLQRLTQYQHNPSLLDQNKYHPEIDQRQALRIERVQQ